MDGLSNLLTLPTSTEAIEVCFGLVHPVEPDLLSVIDKTIRGLSTEELDSIVYENALIDPDEHVGAFISSHLLEFAIGAIAVLMLIIMLLVLYLRTRVLSNRRVREENLRFQKLYSLTNEQLFEYSMGTDTLIMSNLRPQEPGGRRSGRAVRGPVALHHPPRPRLDSGEIRPRASRCAHLAQQALQRAAVRT
ncbi:MAG: hypothetical protein V8S24_04770 [Gordonibacter pamelaeae]